MDSVGINLNNQPVIAWIPNSDDNTKGYAIFNLEWNGFYWIWSSDPVGIVSGIMSTSFTHTDGNPCSHPETYRIAAINPGQAPPFSGWAETVRTIYLEPPQLDTCANTISLLWTSAFYMSPGLGGYDILASTDDVNYFLLNTNPPGDTTFIHTNPLPNEIYSYKIRAFNTDRLKTSSSCLQTLQVETYSKPELVGIISASVENNEFIKLDWKTNDPNVPLQRFTIERRPEDQSLFTEIGFNDEPLDYPVTNFDDESANFSVVSNYYKIVITDICGYNTFPAYTSTSHRTVHLQGAPQSDYTNYLEWNHYEGWDNGVDTYKIWRNIEGTFTELDEVPGADTTYSDPVSALSGQGGVFIYYVEALENGGNSATSKSNWITLEMETKILAPNAFIPGANEPDNEFKPQLSFIAEGSYELQIYNKWGQMIFRSVNTGTGWDGTFNGQLQPAGAYVYLIKCRTPEGQNLEKRGTVTLIR